MQLTSRRYLQGLLKQRVQAVNSILAQNQLATHPIDVFKNDDCSGGRWSQTAKGTKQSIASNPLGKLIVLVLQGLRE
jgi:hypothetical protein